MPVTDEPVDRDARLASVVAEFMEAADAGRMPDTNHWLSSHPDLRPDLEAFLTQSSWIDQKIAPLLDAVVVNAQPPLSTFAGYELIEEIGQGGMGVVYRARQRQPARVDALKMIRAGRFATATERQRFLAEAEAVSRLDHPQIVPIYEVGEAEGRPYFTMKLIEGGDLRAHLPRLRQDPRACASLISDLARAIHHAHQRGVLHRDLKPANVLLDAEGRPHATDFGLAQLAEGTGLTLTGELVGTPPYMAPEQTLGTRNAVTTATDVYGLGAVLYVCLTGQPPFDGGSVAATLDHVRLREPHAPSRVNPGVPRDLDAICLKCLDKEPGRRYSSANALSDDLDRFLAGQPVKARQTGKLERARRWVRRRPDLAALLAITFAALMFGGYLSVRLVWSRAETQAADRLAAGQEFIASLERVRQRRLDPFVGWTRQNLADLQRMAALPLADQYSAELRSETAECLTNVDLHQARIYQEDFEVYEVVYSPDGCSLALGGWGSANNACHIRLVDPADGRLFRELSFPAKPDDEKTTTKVDGIRRIAFSPDGDWLVASTSYGVLFRWNLKAETPADLLWESPERRHLDLALGSSGPRLFACDPKFVHYWDIADNWRGPQSTPVPAGGRLPGIHPQNGQVVFKAGQNSQVLDRRTLQPKGPPVATDWRMENRIFSPGGEIMAWYWSEYLCLSKFGSGTPLQTLTMRGASRAETNTISQVCFSPDGALVAASSELSRHVRVWDVLDGRLMADFVAGKGGSMRIAFDPSGRGLLVAANRHAVLYEITGPAIKSAAGIQPDAVWSADLSLDGKVLACQAKSESGSDEYGVVSFWSATVPNAVRPRKRRLIRTRDKTLLALNQFGNAVVHPWLITLHYFGAASTGSPPINDDDFKKVRFGPDGRLWAATGIDVRAYNVLEWRIEARWSDDADTKAMGVTYYTVAPGLKWVLAGRRDGRVLLLDSKAQCHATWTVSDSPSGQDETSAWEPVTALHLNEDAGLAVAGTENGRVRVFRVPTGEVAADLPTAHRDIVDAAAISPDGRVIVTGGHDGAIRLWQPDGTALLSLHIEGPCTMLAFTPDGQTLFGLVSGERGVRRWDLHELAKRMREHGIDPGY